jgi:hypothetical protein
MKIIAALLVSVVTATAAVAQPYYAAPPPPPPPGYYPPPGYAPPPYERPVEFGRRCEARLRTPEGPRRLVCEIIRPKPIGESCACPPPEPPPGYAPGPYVGGRTIR